MAVAQYTLRRFCNATRQPLMKRGPLAHLPAICPRTKLMVSIPSDPQYSLPWWFSSTSYGSPGEIRTPVDGSLPSFRVQSPSLAGSLFSTLASPLHHRATRDPGLRPSPNKPSARTTVIDEPDFECPDADRSLYIPR